MEAHSLQEAFHRHVWQPFTQMKLVGDPLIIDRAYGSYLVTPSGEKILDAIGSWWVNIHGHNHPAIMGAIQAQLNRLDHVIFAGVAHPGAIELAAKLSELTDHHLPHTFFSDNGSTAVEIAVKMAFQYFANEGQKKRTRIVSLQDGYRYSRNGTRCRFVYSSRSADGSTSPTPPGCRGCDRDVVTTSAAW